jgi:pimeloyl-ACP methyl ester carboxylesterase
MEDSLSVDGINVCFGMEGRGECLLLVHGMGIGRRVWDDLSANASKMFSVWSPDLPGFGCSDMPDAPYSVAYYADFLNRFMETAGIERASVAGISIGGAVAASLAARHPEKVRKLVLAAPAGLTPPQGEFVKPNLLIDANYWLLSHNKEMFVRSFDNLFYEPGKVPVGLIDDVWLRMKKPEYRRTLLRCSQSLAKVDPAFETSLEAIKAPTLIVWGQDDRIIPVSDAERFARKIHGAELKLFERCGHEAPMEHSDAFSGAVVAFLGEEDLYYPVDEK